MHSTYRVFTWLSIKQNIKETSEFIMEKLKEAEMLTVLIVQSRVLSSSQGPNS